MRLGVLNRELGIFAIDSLEDLGAIQEKQIRGQMPEGAGLNDLAFFYMKDRDWVVLNRSHALYEYYADIISCYLELSETGRREATEKAPVEEVKAALRILDSVIWARQQICGKGGCIGGQGKGKL